jgi:hypothetical protein
MNFNLAQALNILPKVPGAISALTQEWNAATADGKISFDEWVKLVIKTFVVVADLIGWQIPAPTIETKDQPAVTQLFASKADLLGKVETAINADLLKIKF